MKPNQFKCIGAACVLAVLGAGLQAQADNLILPPDPKGDITMSTWNTAQDSGATLNVTNPTDPVFGTVLEMNYNLNAGAWVNVQSPSFNPNINLTGLGNQGNALTFRMLGDGQANQLKVEVTDSTGHTYQSTTVSTKAATWTTVTFPFSASAFTWESGSDSLTAFTGNSVSKMAFTVVPSAGGTGSVTLDELGALNIPPPPHPELIIDDFETAAGHNLLGFLAGNLSNLLNQIVNNSVVQAFSGNNSFHITALATGDTSKLDGMYEVIGNTTTPFSTAPFTHLSFYIQAKAPLVGNFNIEIKDMNNNAATLTLPGTGYINGNQVPVGSWKQVLVPLAGIPSNVDLTHMGTISIITYNGYTGVQLLTPPYDFYVDRVSLVAVTNTAQTQIVFDDFNTYYTSSSWKTKQANGTTLSLTTVPGEEGSALKMQYSFPSNIQATSSANTPTVQAYRGFGLNVLGDNSDAFMLNFKGMGTVSDTLEFKITDANNTTFIVRNQKITNTNGIWQTLTVPYKNFTFFTGASNSTTTPTFDFTNMSYIAFAISTPLPGGGGQGTFDLHRITYGKAADFQQTYTNNQVLKSFVIDNNPFSPQTNSIKAFAHFTYVLNEKAKISLKVYDVPGNVVYKNEPGDVLPGSEAPITWDGTDLNGKLLRNGIYLYIFSAQGKKSTQKIKNVIGLVR